MSELTKTLRNKIRKLEEEVDSQRRLKESAMTGKEVAEAKLESYKEADQGDRDVTNAVTRESNSQVEWLRNLVENLVIDPEVILMLARSYSIRAKEDRKTRNQEFERQARMDRLYRDQAARNPAGMNVPTGMGIERPKDFLSKRSGY